MKGSQVLKDRNGVKLQEGQRAIVHPTKTSQSKKPYEVNLVVADQWGEGPELMTEVPGKHKARINNYLMSRLEVIQ